MNDSDSRFNRLILIFLLLGLAQTLLTGSYSHWIPLIAGILVGVLVCRGVYR